MNIPGDKTLIMLISPSAMGKSTIVYETVRIDNEFQRVRSFTTRTKRSDDKPNQFFYLTTEELAEKRNENAVITEVIFPTTGQTYGTLAASYNGTYCILETLANSVKMYRALPFKKILAITITTPTSLWHSRFLERYPEPSEEAKKRLEEAKLSINWSLSQASDHFWLVNDGTPDDAARKLIAIARDDQGGDDGASHARAILELLEGGVWK
jgi:guanylate kinase